MLIGPIQLGADIIQIPGSRKPGADICAHLDVVLHIAGGRDAEDFAIPVGERINLPDHFIVHRSAQRREIVVKMNAVNRIFDKNLLNACNDICDGYEGRIAAVTAFAVAVGIDPCVERQPFGMRNRNKIRKGIETRISS